jgi:N-acetylglucosaminyl-diphospho-decaprenol L-rhamnosyltransferase
MPATTNQLRLDVVIVSYRSRELVRRCLESLRENPASARTSVFVVDNDSNDGTVEMIRRHFPDVDVDASCQNLGFSMANNRALRRGTSDYVLVLNPDTRLTEESLDSLLAIMERRPDVGIIGPRLVCEDGEFDHASRRSFPTILGALGHFTGVGRRTERGRLAQYRAPDIRGGPVDAVNGAFMLMRRRALENVGLFDEGFWMYMEDLDLCFRFARAGWVTWYEPSVTVVHVKAGTSGTLRRPKLNYAFHYGMLRFYRKHYAPENRLATNLAVYAGIAVKLGLSLVRTELRRIVRCVRSAS